MNKKNLLLGIVTVLGAGAISAVFMGKSTSLKATSATDCNHSNVEHHDAVAPTYLDNGSIEYWCCCDCHSSFNHNPTAGDTDIIADTLGNPTDKTDGRHVDKVDYVLSEPIGWTYIDGSEDLTAPAGFTKVNKYAGKWASTPNARFNFFDLSNVKSFKFAAATSNNDKYLEVFPSYGGSSIFSTSGTTWKIWEFVDEGNGYFQLYQNGSWKGVHLDLNANLSDLWAKMGDADIYITEVRAVLKSEIASDKYELIAASPASNLNGTLSTTETFDLGYGTGMSAAYSAAAKYASKPFNSVVLNSYSKVFFGLKGAGSNLWTYIGNGSGKLTSEDALFQSWNTASLTRQSDGKWTLDFMKAHIADLELSNLNELNLKVGDGNYIYSPLYGQLRQEATDWKVAAEYVADRSTGAWKNYDTYSPKYDLPKDGLTQHIYYNDVAAATNDPINLSSVTMSNYVKLKFFMQSPNGGYMYVYQGTTKLFEMKCPDTWTEFNLEYDASTSKWNWSFASKSGSIEIEDLNEINFNCTWSRHWFSTCYGVEAF